MRSAAIFAPIVLPLLAAAMITALGSARISIGRAGAATGAWTAAAAMGALWIPVRSPQDLALGPLGFGSSLDVRIDAAAFAFGLLVTIPVALLLSVQRRTWQESAIAMLALAASLAAVESGGVVVTAIAGGSAATLVLVLLDTEDPQALRPSWAALLAGWLALAWVGVLLQIRGGTAVFAAVPVSAVTPAVFGLLAFSALLVSGLFPWRAWPARVWTRPSLGIAGLSVALLYPLGFYLLVRGYELGAGHYPSSAFNVFFGVMGALIAFAAALRAQAAGSRREFFAEVVPGLGGVALMSIGIGSSLGLVAGLSMLATAAALAAAMALRPDRMPLASLAAIAAGAGLPGGLVFGSRVLTVVSTFEAGDFLGLIGLFAMASWAIWVVGSARAVGLPAGEPGHTHEAFPRLAAAVAAVTILAGPALAALLYSYADPVAAAVMEPVPVVLATRLSVVQTTSTVLPSLTLFAPLVVIGILAFPGIGARHLPSEQRPAVIKLDPPSWWMRAQAVAQAARVPEQYRSIINPRALELAASGDRPWLWLAALAALGFAVTR